MPATDIVLLTRWTRDGDAEAFNEIAGRHAGMVYAACRRILRDNAAAQDAVQECFETLVSARKGPREHLAGWLHAVAVSKALNQLKARKRREAREAQYAVETQSNPYATWDDVYEHVDAALAELPEALRTPIVLHFFEGFTHDLVAAELNMSRSAVTRRIQRGVERLRKTLARKGILIPLGALMAGLGHIPSAEAVPTSLSTSLAKLALAGPAQTAVAGSTLAAVTALLVAHKAAVSAVVAVAVVAGGAWGVKRVVAPHFRFPQYVAIAKSASDDSVARTPSAASGGKTETPGSAPSSFASTSPTNRPDTGSISGTVYDAVSGKPLDKILVKFVLDGAAPAAKGIGAETNAEGRYQCDGVAPGEYQLNCNSARIPQEGQSEMPVVTVKSGFRLEGVDITLQLGPRISGRVVDGQGNPVFRVVVYSGEYEKDGTEFRRDSFDITDANGVFWLFAKEGAKKTYLSATWNPEWAKHTAAPKAGLVADLCGPYVLGKDDVSDVVIKMYPGGTVSGTVVDMEGHPLANASVELVPIADSYEKSQRLSRSSKSDSAGRFTVWNIAQHAYRLVARPGEWAKEDQQYLNAQAPYDHLEIARSQSVENVTAVVDLGLSISGRVMDESGEPIKNALLMIYSGDNVGTAISGEGGNYVVRGLPEGDYNMQILRVDNRLLSGRDFPQLNPRRVAAGSDGIDLVLQLHPAGAIDVHVVASETGQPVQQFELGWTVADASAPHIEKRDNPSGMFRVEGVPSQSLTLTAKAEGRATATVAVAAATPGQKVRSVSISMSPEAVLRGSVRDDRGKPVSGASILTGVTPQSGHPEDHTVTTSDAAGSFRLAGLAAGTVSLTFFHPQYVTAVANPNVVTGQENSISVVMTRGGSVTGIVTIDGKPLPGASVGILESIGDPYPKTAKTDGDGIYRIDGISSGNINILLSDNSAANEAMGYRTLKCPAVVSVGQATTADFLLKSAAAEVAGKITRNGKSCAEATITLCVDADGLMEERQTRTAADGTFKLAQLPAGTAVLVVVAGSYGEACRLALNLEQRSAVHRDIELSDGAALRGHVLGMQKDEHAIVTVYSGDVPLSNASAKTVFHSLVMTRGMASPQVAPNADGAYRVAGLEPGRYTVVAAVTSEEATKDLANPTIRFVVENVDVTADSETVLDLTPK